MQRRPHVPSEKSPPSVGFVALVSLFGYPGAGHWMLGSGRWAAFFATVFTLSTVAAVSEVWYLLPELWKMYQGYATTISRLPNFSRLGLWVLITVLAWLGSAWHSAGLARRLSSPGGSENLGESVGRQKEGGASPS